MKGISCGCAITVLFIGCLAAVGQCRLEQAVRSYRDDSGANTSASLTTMGASPDGGSKLNLKFCAPRDCKTKGEPWEIHCVCCLVMPDVPCWHSTKECQENCRACNPSCTSQPAKELHV